MVDAANAASGVVVVEGTEVAEAAKARLAKHAVKVANRAKAARAAKRAPTVARPVVSHEAKGAVRHEVRVATAVMAAEPSDRPK